MAKLIGTNPNQVPTNADLGSMAYQDANNAKIGGLAYPSSDGTNGQVLTTNGSGTLSFVDAASGGVTLLDTQTCSGSVLTFTLPTTGYAYFKLTFHGVVGSQNSEQLRIKVYGTTGNYLFQMKNLYNGTDQTYTSTGDSAGVLISYSQLNSNTAGCSGEFLIFESATAGVPAYGTYSSSYTDDNGNLSFSRGGWKTANNEVQTSIEVRYSGGNPNSGTVRLYGITA